MIIGRDIVAFYELFYSQKYGNKEYKFQPTEKASKEIDKFLLHFDNKYQLITLGRSFLIRYFTFQFNRVKDQSFKRFASKDVAGRIQIYDIIGRKAIEYFENRDTKFDYLIEGKVPLLNNNEIDENDSLLYFFKNKAEEIEKQRFFNTDKGLLNCIERTSLFDHRSKNCIICNHKKDCKILLEKNYNSIYLDRGYGSKTA